MSFWSKIFGPFSKSVTGGTSSQTYIVDAASLIPSTKGKKPRFTPRIQIDLLKQLSRFVEQEKISLTLVFEGTPLNHAPDKKKYRDIMVRYADTGEALPSMIVKLTKEQLRRYPVIVITSDRRLEERSLVNGAQVMRGSTFRKAFGYKDPGKGDRSRSRNRRSSSQKKPQNDAPQRNANKNQRKKRPEQRDIVNELIDVV